MQFLHIAFGSAVETGYLVDVSHRLGFIPGGLVEALRGSYDRLARMLRRQVEAVELQVDRTSSARRGR